MYVWHVYVCVWADKTNNWYTDVDICALGLDDCPVNSDCEANGPGTYTCICKPGFIGSDCSKFVILFQAYYLLCYMILFLC